MTSRSPDDAMCSMCRKRVFVHWRDATYAAKRLMKHRQHPKHQGWHVYWDPRCRAIHLGHDTSKHKRATRRHR